MLPEVFDMVLAAPEGHNLANKYILSVKELRLKSNLFLERTKTELTSKAISKRLNCVEKLRHKWTEITTTIETQLKPKMKNVEDTAVELNSELAKAGMTKKAA